MPRGFTGSFWLNSVTAPCFRKNVPIIFFFDAILSTHRRRDRAGSCTACSFASLVLRVRDVMGAHRAHNGGWDLKPSSLLCNLDNTKRAEGRMAEASWQNLPWPEASNPSCFGRFYHVPNSCKHSNRKPDLSSQPEQFAIITSTGFQLEDESHLKRASAVPVVTLFIPPTIRRRPANDGEDTLAR